MLNYPFPQLFRLIPIPTMILLDPRGERIPTKKAAQIALNGFFLVGIVGMAGFEPAASTSQMWRDTGLRYIPSRLGLQK